MIRYANFPKIRDHLAAVLAALAAAHAIGLIDIAGYLPQGALALDRLPAQIIGVALCGLVYAIVITTLVRRRLVKGPLYRCAETRPAQDYGKAYHPASKRLLESWQYR